MTTTAAVMSANHLTLSTLAQCSNGSATTALDEEQSPCDPTSEDDSAANRYACDRPRTEGCVDSFFFLGSPATNHNRFALTVITVVRVGVLASTNARKVIVIAITVVVVGIVVFVIFIYNTGISLHGGDVVRPAAYIVIGRILAKLNALCVRAEVYESERLELKS